MLGVSCACCSECGEHITSSYYDRSSWAYKTNNEIQCSYTCYDHAKLRGDEQLTIPKKKYAEYVFRNEVQMLSQGKTILHPINVKQKKTNSLYKTGRRL